MKKFGLQQFAIIIFCLALAGPEFGIGLELIVLLEAFGIELFVLSLSASLWSNWYFVKAKLEELDPYFFTSPLKDLLKCPALIAHSIPGSMGLLTLVLGLSVFSI